MSSANPLRIGLLMHSLNPRGGVVHTLELADALCDRGHQVTVFAPATPGQRLFRATRAGLSLVPVSAASASLPELVTTRAAALAQHLRAWPGLDQLDLLHSQDGITANALAQLREQGRISGFVRTVHHLDTFDDPQMQALQARSVHAASQLLCVSPMWQAVLRDDWGLKAEVVPNGVNLQRYQAQSEPADAALLAGLGLPPHGPLWLAVGGVEERKNPVRLLQAFAQALPHLGASQGSARLVIAGGASLLDHDPCARQFKATLQALGPGLASQVLVTGALPDAALPALYRRATALVMASLREGFGLVVLEALACGTPVVVSRLRPFTDHLAPHEALWADPLDVADLSAALRRSLAPGQRAPVLAAAPGVCQRFAWSRSAASHEAIYRVTPSLSMHHTRPEITHA